VIRTTAVLEDNTIATGLSLEELKAKENEIRWFWTDFNLPDEKEIAELERFFGFHPLAVEDCVNRLQRPKIDYYEGYAFFVLHYLHTEKIQKKEINIFLADRYIVTFHSEKSDQVERAWKEITMGTVTKRWGPFYVFYLILDKTVDDFFRFFTIWKTASTSSTNKEKWKPCLNSFFKSEDSFYISGIPSTRCRKSSWKSWIRNI